MKLLPLGHSRCHPGLRSMPMHIERMDVLSSVLQAWGRVLQSGWPWLGAGKELMWIYSSGNKCVCSTSGPAVVWSGCGSSVVLNSDSQAILETLQ